jgi:hypothetical protein
VGRESVVMNISSFPEYGSQREVENGRHRLVQKMYRPGEEAKYEKISICDGNVGAMGHGVNANFASGAVKFEVK